MSYKLENNESLNIGIKRIILEQIEKSIQSMENRQGQEEEVIHDVRKRGKKIRGAIRLVRDDLGKKTYQKENAFFRDLTGNLSELRDATSMIAAIKALRTLKINQPEKQTLDKAHKNLQRKRTSLYKDIYSESLMAEIKSDLEDAKERYTHLEIKAHEFSDINPSLSRVYKRGKKAFDKAYEDPTVEGFHDWRKRAKYLWYHYRILKNLWPNVFKAYASETKQLSDYLGDDHDYAVLLEKLDSGYLSFKDPNARTILEKLINMKKKQLLIEAYPLGRKVYTESNKRFIKRIAGFWDVWADPSIRKKVKIPNFA